jgi:hypothetical protein
MGFQTPEDVARDGMPPSITHVVQVEIDPAGQRAYVQLAIETGGGFYIDETTCVREADGGWTGDTGTGSGWTDRTLEDLRRNPLPRSIR